MPLTSEQKVAARLIATMKQDGKTYNQIADQVGVDGKTLYNWRQIPEFQDEIALVDGVTVDELLVTELKNNPNPNLFNTYYRRFGLFRDEDIKDVGQLLGMTEDDRQRIIEYIVATYGPTSS